MSNFKMDNPFLEKKVSELCEKYFDEKAEGVRFLGGGSFGKAFSAKTKKGKLVFKFYRISGMAKQEGDMLKTLSENTSVSMPKVLCIHEDENVCLLVMSFIEGKNVLDPVFLFKSKRQRLSFAKAVAEGLHELHNVKGEKYGDFSSPEYISWKEFYIETKAEPTLTELEKLVAKGKYSKKKLSMLKRATKIFIEDIPEPEYPALIHGDLNIMNIMADPKTLTLTGFIDPYGTMFADREFDLFQSLNMWGGYFLIYDTYKQLYPVSEFCDFKTAYYAALHESSFRLKDAVFIPLWEELNFIRLKKVLKKYKK